MSTSTKYTFTVTQSSYVFYAWATPNKYYLTVDANGGYNMSGGSIIESTHDYGSTYGIPAPTRDGYVFTGWTVTSGLNTSTAMWGATPSTTINSIPSPSTKCFNGDDAVWFRNLNPTNNASVTLTANWEAITYTVDVNPNGGTYNGSTVTTSLGAKSYDSVFSVLAPTRMGYTFAGWMVTSGLITTTARWGTTANPTTSISSTTKCVNGTNAVYFKNITPLSGGSVTLTANWTANYYTLTINPNGGSYSGSASNKTVSVQYTSTYTLQNPTRDGFNFTGWKITSGTSTSVSDNIVTMGYTNSTVTAQWAEKFWAEDEYVASSFAGGTGTQTDPYIIKTAGQLGKLSRDSFGNNFDGVYFKLGANIDLGAHQWYPIGYNNQFKGVFDGGLYKVSNLRITEGDFSYVGLFIHALSVSNLILDSPTITVGTYVGAIAGRTLVNAVIRNCMVTNANLNGVRCAGGLVGRAVTDNVIIENCIVKNSTIEGEMCGAFIGDKLLDTGSISTSGAYNISGANCKAINGNTAAAINAKGVFSDTELEGKKIYGSINDFGGFTYNANLNDGMPVPEGLFAVGGQSGSENVYNYLASKGFENS